MSHADQLARAALDAVNQGLQALDAEPLHALPAGVREDGYGCPIARALGEAIPGVYVVPEEVQLDDEVMARRLADAWASSPPSRHYAGRWRVCTPRPVFDFACAFDDHKLSDDLYEASAA